MSFQGNDGTPKAYLGEGGAIAAGLAVIAGTAANQVKVPTAANQMPIGITKYATSAAGEPVEVIVDGFADATVDGSGTAIAWGDPLTVAGTSGKLVKSALTNGLHVCAIAQEAATGSADVISVKLVCNYLPTA